MRRLYKVVGETESADIQASADADRADCGRAEIFASELSRLPNGRSPIELRT